MNKQKVTSQINDLLDQFDLEDRLEILANVFISQGLTLCDDQLVPDKVTPENVVVTLMSLREKEGETLGTALLQQGLVLLMWLENT